LVDPLVEDLVGLTVEEKVDWSDHLRAGQLVASMVPSSAVKWEALLVSKMVAQLENVWAGKLDDKWGSQMAERWEMLLDGRMGHMMAEKKAAMLVCELEMHWVVGLDHLLAEMLVLMMVVWTVAMMVGHVVVLGVFDEAD
jgi:hypothetical protein